MLDPEDEIFDRKLANHLVSLYYKSSEHEQQELLVSGNFVPSESFINSSVTTVMKLGLACHRQLLQLRRYVTLP